MKLWGILLLFGTINLFAQEKELPKYVHFIQKKDSAFITSKNTLNVPLHIVIEDQQGSFKQTILLKPYDSVIVHSFSKSATKQSIANQFRFNRYFGNPFLKHYDTLYNYYLPFQRGKRYKVLQGHNSKYSHNSSTSKYAIDFQMPVGDTICAARGGIVLTAVKKYKKGGRNKKYKPYANYVLLYHPDGTFSQYVHLKHKGVFVKRGDTIQKGQVIGLSGNTGWSTEPHLHFSVYKSVKGKLISIPAILNGIPSKRFKKGRRVNFK